MNLARSTPFKIEQISYKEINNDILEKIILSDEIILFTDKKTIARKFAMRIYANSGFSGKIRIIKVPKGYDIKSKCSEGHADDELYRLIGDAEEFVKPDVSYDDIYLNAILNIDQKLLAEILNIELKKQGYKVISEIIDHRNHIRFYIQFPEKCYFEEALSFVHIAYEILKPVLKTERKRIIETISGNLVIAVSENYGKLMKRFGNMGFINSIIDAFGRLPEIIHDSIPWNTTPECLPCLDGLIDFSTEKIFRRVPNDDEFFKNPIKYNVDQINDAEDPKGFFTILNQMFSDTGTRQTAIECLSQMMANKGAKTIQIWFSRHGNNGKNTIIGIMRQIFGKERIAVVKPALIMADSDKSERRFASGELEGATAGIIDESTEMEALDISKVKSLTSLDDIATEKKGMRQKNIMQTWVLVLLSNELPRFYPPDDAAFLNRLICLPFSAVYYSNENEKQNRISSGVNPDNLYIERNKLDIMHECEIESPGILKMLILSYLHMKTENNGKVEESAECKEAKSVYLFSNDKMRQFFEDCFVLSDENFISNQDFKAVYLDYFDEFMKGSFKKKFIDRYKLKSSSRWEDGKTVRGIIGLRKKDVI
jgi:phage/plasmid-associated DNA primase